MDWGPIILSFKLATVTTVILFIVAIPISYWLAFTKNKLKPVLETLVSLPLVLPPTVLGFYLLLVFSPQSVLGSLLLDGLGLSLVFSFPGLVVGSIIYSLPFMVHPIQNGLSGLSPSIREAAQVIGKSSRSTLFYVLLPNIKPALITGVVLSFAHTLGEFGVVLMIGGNIPNQTRVASIAIYDQVEALNYASAHGYSLVLLVLAFTVLLGVYLINGGYFKKFWR